jgi:antirestriction protein
MFNGFITNLGKYNEGELVGKWITFPISEEDLEKVYEEIGINEEYEEIFFTDWECDFDMGFGEYEDIESLNELAERLEGADLDAIEAYIEATGENLEDALDHIDDCIFYHGYTLEEVAEEIVNDCYNLPEFALRYFDYEAFARDLSYNSYYEVSSGVIVI